MRSGFRVLLATTTALTVLATSLTATAGDRYGPEPEFDDAYAYSRREAVQGGGYSRYEQQGYGEGYEERAETGGPLYADDGYGGRPVYAEDRYADEGYGRGDAYAYREQGGGYGYREERYREEGYRGSYEDGEYREERWQGGGGYAEGYGWREDEGFRGGGEDRRVKRKWTCAEAPVEKAWKMGCPGAGELRLSGDFFYGATGGVGPEYIDGGGGGGGGVVVAGAGAGAGAYAYAQAGASVNIRIGGGKRRGPPGKPGHPPKGGGGCGKCK